MALVEGCRHSLEISVPVDEVETETGRVAADVQKRAKIPGFRPGKVPSTLIRKQFAGEIRQKVLENLVPKHLQQHVENENLHIVGQYELSDVHFHEGEPLRFTAKFEVFPEIELGEYKGIEVPYHDPEVTDADIDKRLEELREQKAQYVNIDPRPLEDGDYAVVSLESISPMEGGPMKQDEMVLQINGPDTLAAFSENLRGLSPGDEKDFEVSYPEDYGSAKLAGKTVMFHAVVKGLRKKDLPEINEEFAQDMGDFRNVDELREAVRRALFGQREHQAQEDAKNQIVEKIVERHDFPVPEVFIERQIKNRLENLARIMVEQGMDPSKLKIDWNHLREEQREKAISEVKASMLLGRISEREAIGATRDEVNREVERIARQNREPVAALQMKYEKDGTMGRIASQIQTQKTLNFLFENARKTIEG